MLTDQEFIRAFEATTLPVAQFDHAAHVRAGWWYVQHYSIGEAIDRFSQSLKAFAAANGANRKYHETVTIAWMLVIAERVHQSRELDWAAFAARFPELFATPSLLAQYYSTERLGSEQARVGFVMPDAAPRNT